MAKYSGSNIFEKLGALIPGYKGYAEREGRRDTDKILRDHISASLQQVSSIINKWSKLLLKKGKLESVSEIEEIQRKITIISDQIKFSQYGSSGFFDVVQVKKEQLDKLYLHDLAFKSKADALIETIKREDSEGKIALGRIINQLNELKDALSSRGNIITEIE